MAIDDITKKEFKTVLDIKELKHGDLYLIQLYSKENEITFKNGSIKTYEFTINDELLKIDEHGVIVDQSYVTENPMETLLHKSKYLNNEHHTAKKMVSANYGNNITKKLYNKLERKLKEN